MGRHSTTGMNGRGRRMQVLAAAAAVVVVGVSLAAYVAVSRASSEPSRPTLLPPPNLAPTATPTQDRRPTGPPPTLAQGEASPAVLRLQQLLAQTGYLPLSWHPLVLRRFGPPRVRDLAAPRPGSFRWRFSPPRRLRPLWAPGVYSTMTRGAVMTFQYTHGMPVSGVAGPAVWKDLDSMARKGRRSPLPYSYVFVSEAIPERLQLWVNGRLVLTTPANTGIAAAPTVQGTWPVYLRFVSATMSGTDPSGQHYDDPGVPWISYFNGGDAVHGFLRASYGSPQSLGCVELPYAAAERAWHNMTYGTLVTVGP